MLSILCHFHGLLFARATLGFYSYIDQRNGPYSEGMFVVIVVDECFGDLGDLALVEIDQWKQRCLLILIASQVASARIPTS